jgi:hypothetical protein
MIVGIITSYVASQRKINTIRIISKLYRNRFSVISNTMLDISENHLLGFIRSLKQSWETYLLKSIAPDVD